MNVQASLLENIQTSYLAPVKSKHNIVKRGIEILNNQAIDETITPPQLITVDPERVREMISWAVYVCETSQVPDEIQAYTKKEQDSTLFMALYTIFNEAIRTRVTDKIFKETLHCFHLSKQYQDLFLQTYLDNQVQLTLLARNETTTLPSMESFDWRLDVIISTTALNKAFIPILLLQLTTTDGKIHTFECQVSKFHQLRYSVAKMLANMQTIDQHPTLMRLVD